MNRPLNVGDRDAALRVVNEAACWYREFLPPDEYQEPEMTPAEWEAEAHRMTWYGAFLAGTLVGVMALEYAGYAALFRHGYVLPDHQRKGVGSALLRHLADQVRGPKTAGNALLLTRRPSETGGDTGAWS